MNNNSTKPSEENIKKELSENLGETSKARKKILVVDQDEATLQSFMQLLQSQFEKIEVLISTDGKEAIQIINSYEVDLVIVDLELKNMAFAEFVTLLDEEYPAVPLFSMGTPELKVPQEQQHASNLVEHFTKPIDDKALIRRVFEELDARSLGGTIHGISLESFLQMVETDAKTCAIKVSSKEDLGYMALARGELIAANVGEIDNETAAYTMISWDNPTIEIQKIEQKTKKKIKQPLMNIIMEGLRIKDELLSRGQEKIYDQDRPGGPKIHRAFTAGKRISLEIGMQLQLKVKEDNTSFQSLLIGMAPDEYIIIRQPEYFKTIKHKFTKDAIFMIRYLYAGTYYIFETKLMGLVQRPVGIMIFEYPRVIEYYELRNNKRVNCAIPFKISDAHGEVDGHIADISKTGCRCQIRIMGHADLPSIQIGNEVILRCRFPEHDEDVRINGLIQNINRSKIEMGLGLEFHNNTFDIQKLISWYIRNVEQFSRTIDADTI